MKITGVVAEYNPFHMGHEYQLKKARELSRCDGLAVVMSGNFVQRGEPAIIDKFKRAETAIYGGADLVIELPMPFSCQNAEMFSLAAINELKKLPVTALSFGCESDNTLLLKKVAEAQLNSPIYNKMLKEEMKNGISYPNALSNVLVSLLGDLAKEAIISPNNVLAVEYIKSMIKYNLNWDIVPVKRIGKDHNDKNLTGHYDSATAIRKGILNDSCEYSCSLTPASIEMLDKFYEKHESFNKLNNYLDYLYYKIIDIGIDGLNDIYEVSEGLNNKIYTNIFKYDNIDDFIMALKSKRYTYSKLRRMILNIILGITYDDINDFMLPYNQNYIKILAFNDVGKQIIKLAQNTGTVTINRYSDYRKNNIFADKLNVFKFTNKSTDLFYLPFKNKEINQEYTQNAIYVKNK
ncbi:MAG: nucleotidyltransferase [Sedimentibacter sp.]|uniref:nucleotidyltransferase n=1 Tax=Sedimentibacter sp. TaxID=1960295 RepID=UPI0029827618|nr:nucleotidyltransferase [Sedimentibacter sp.]MDW5300275.1 nucleotidyltransferase [Sedimentibacter sp.]